jgi:hypothetical protein
MGSSSLDADLSNCLPLVLVLGSGTGSGLLADLGSSGYFLSSLGALLRFGGIDRL